MLSLHLFGKRAGSILQKCENFVGNLLILTPCIRISSEIGFLSWRAVVYRVTWLCVSGANKSPRAPQTYDLEGNIKVNLRRILGQNKSE